MAKTADQYYDELVEQGVDSRFAEGWKNNYQEALDKNVSLTENEIIALKTCLNYQDRGSQLSDNYSNGGAEEFRGALGWTNHQVAGLISSLEQKEMGYMDQDGRDELKRVGRTLKWVSVPLDIFWLTDLGVHTIFNIIDEEESK